MKFRKLDQLDIFPIGLGALQLSAPGRPDINTAKAVIEKFINSGGNFIDTADIYGLDSHDRGHSEKLIHDILNQINAKHVIVATKGGATRPDGGWSFIGGGDPKKLRNACESSLKNLNVECHELYYLHGPDPLVPFTESLGELIKLQEEGKIKRIGIANVNLSQVKTATALTKISAVQNRCNPFCKLDFKNNLINFCHLNNILYVAYGPLGGWTEHQKLLPHYEGMEINSYQLNLAWLLSKAEHILPIPGMESAEHVEINLGANDLVLDPSHRNALDNLPDLYTPAHID